MTAVSNDGTLVAASVEYSGVTIYNTTDDTQRDISLDTLSASDIGGAAFSPDNNWLYIADYGNRAVIVVDLSDDSVDRTIDMDGARTWALEASRDGNYLYVHTYSSGDIYKIALNNADTVSGPLDDTGSYAWSMCLSADGATLYSPTYSSDVIAVVDTATMTLTTTWASGGSSPYSCEMDNDGNLIVLNYDDTTIDKFAPDGSVTTSASVGSTSYAAAPSCDTIYVADEGTQASIPTFDLATLAAGNVIVPDEMDSVSGFWGWSADRSLDGSVVAIGGYYSADGLAIIKTDCGASPDPELPNTGADLTAMGISASVALGMLIAGAIALIAIRRRNA